MRLFLHVLTIQLQITLCNQLENDIKGEGLLYIHTILSHFGDWFETLDFRNASSEAGEGFFARAKPIMQRFTSHQMSSSLVEVFIRLPFQSEQIKYKNMKGTTDESQVYNCLFI